MLSYKTSFKLLRKAMGASNRFGEFSKLISRNLPNKSCSIVDVAGGKGDLQIALKKQGFKNVVTYEKKKIRNRKLNKRSIWFIWQDAPVYDAVVALHPDEATDQAVLYCIKHKIPGFVCPCCVLPTATKIPSNTSFTSWCKHLENLVVKAGGLVFWTHLPIKGKNEVMVIKWEK